MWSFVVNNTPKHSYAIKPVPKPVPSVFNTIRPSQTNAECRNDTAAALQPEPEEWWILKQPPAYPLDNATMQMNYQCIIYRSEVGEGQSQGKYSPDSGSGCTSGRRSEKEEAEGKFFPGWRAEDGGWRVESDKKECKNFLLEPPQD